MLAPRSLPRSLPGAIGGLGLEPRLSEGANSALSHHPPPWFWKSQKEFGLEEEDIDVLGVRPVVKRWPFLSHGPAVLCLLPLLPLSTPRDTVLRRHPTCSTSAWAQT